MIEHFRRGSVLDFEIKLYEKKFNVFLGFDKNLIRQQMIANCFRDDYRISLFIAFRYWISGSESVSGFDGCLSFQT